MVSRGETRGQKQADRQIDRMGTNKSKRRIVQNGLAGTVDRIGRANQADRRDLRLGVLGDGGDDVGLDLVLDGKVVAEVAKVREVVRVNGQLVDRNIIGGTVGVCPTEDCISRSVQNILGVGTGKVGSKRDVEGVEDGRVHDHASLVEGRGRGIGGTLVSEFL